jgi:hypothetical protein
MTFRPEAIRGAGGLTTSGGPGGSGGRHTGNAAGVVDYRLARQQVIKQFQKGRLSKLDVCDAHPELRRAASGAGKPTDEPCPICEEGPLSLVTYAFGSRLPAGGRCVTTAKDMARLSQRRSQVTCYVVEVCPDCAWNHLARVFQVGGDET